MTTATRQRNVRPRLDALFDQVGPEALDVSFAKALAEAHGMNSTSAGIRFYRWRAARMQPAQQVEAAQPQPQAA